MCDVHAGAEFDDTDRVACVAQRCSLLGEEVAHEVHGGVPEQRSCPLGTRKQRRQFLFLLYSNNILSY